jgi:26S proteasome regulatory subunit N8
MSVKTNDQLMAIYISSLIRAITAFHDLIENKIQNRQQQEESDSKREQENAAKGDKDAKKVGSPNSEQKEEQESSDKSQKN